ncbi:hypothetical protein Tco_0927672 [Tanacetum coccineum]
MASLDRCLNPLFSFKECLSCGSLYNKGYCCTPDSSQQPLHDCPKCGNPVDGLRCQTCPLLRKKLKEVWFTICEENRLYQDLLNTYESSNDNTNVVNAPQEPFVVNQRHCFHCKDVLGDGEFCQRCTCMRCGSGLIDDDDFEDIKYVDASLPDSELVSLEEVNDVDQEKGEFDLENILQVQDVILQEKLLNINRLIANIESLNDISTPNYVLKSPSSVPISVTDSDSFFEESYDSFLFEVEPDQGGLTSIVMDEISDNSTNDPLLELPEFESFHFDPSFPRPPLKPPDVEISLIIETDTPVINDFDELNEDKCFDSGGEASDTRLTHWGAMLAIPSYMIGYKYVEVNGRLRSMQLKAVIDQWMRLKQEECMGSLESSLKPINASGGGGISKTIFSLLL